MPKVRFIRSGGNDLDAITFERLEKEFNAPVPEIYGMTETAPGIFCNKIISSRRLGYYRIPVCGSENLDCEPRCPKDEVGLVGEICLRGRNIMSGYINNPAANREAFVDGLFRVGDFGIIHEDGYLQLTGRIKDIINKGGEKTSPSKVENIVQSHELVQRAVRFKVLYEICGEDIGKRLTVF
jgi:acyl-CoA synthetase (AMP-forming)/AMP-acid ligase II